MPPLLTQDAATFDRPDIPVFSAFRNMVNNTFQLMNKYAIIVNYLSKGLRLPLRENTIEIWKNSMEKKNTMIYIRSSMNLGSR